MDGQSTTPAALDGRSALGQNSARLPPHLPDYELLRRIGSGSYGEVWIARNVLGQYRAVKFVYRSRFADPRPFEREFEGIQRFEPISRSSPSQLHILHVGKNDDEGCFYYVMELADAAGTRLTPSDSSPTTSGRVEPVAAGSLRAPRAEPDVGSYEPRTLRSDLEHRGRLAPAECVEIGVSLATALAHLHGQGLVHRDIKPSNIIFVNGVAKLGDIGLVTDAGDTQSVVGTEGYLPPEGPGTPQADLYSLGKVFYEMSTGLDRRRFPELPEDSWNWPDRDQLMEFNEIVLRACAKDPAQRYGAADDLRADLELLTAGRSVKKARSSTRRWWIARRASVGAALIGITVGAVSWLSRSVPPEVAEGGPPSTNEMANALCEKALRNLRADNQRGYPEVYTNFHRAIALDPNFARPYAGLLELMIRENMPGIEFPPSENVQTIAQRLSSLAPESAAAHCGQAILAYYGWDFPSAERHVQTTIQIAPDYELGHTWYGFILEYWGRTAEARQQLEISHKLNPWKVQIHRCLAHIYYVERNFKKAIEMYRQAIGWEPHDLPCYRFMADAYRAMGDYPNAIDKYEEMESVSSGKKPEPGSRFDRMRAALARDGVNGYWEEMWRQTPANHFYDRARIQLHLGNTNVALELLERSYQTPERYGPISECMSYLVFDEVWDPLHQHPLFRQLLDKLGFTEVMAKSQ